MPSDSFSSTPSGSAVEFTLTDRPILIVDDDPAAGNLLEIALRRLGHEPLVAVHPEDALQLFDAHIEAVISDIEMPGMNGVELARALRERRSDVPIAFCTGSDPTDRIATEAATLGPVFEKRWDAPHVSAVVDSLVKS